MNYSLFLTNPLVVVFFLPIFFLNPFLIPRSPFSGGAVQTSVNKIAVDVLGSCDLFEEKQIGGDRYNFFTGCPQAKTCTIIMRGGAEQVS